MPRQTRAQARVNQENNINTDNVHSVESSSKAELKLKTKAKFAALNSSTEEKCIAPSKSKKTRATQKIKRSLSDTPTAQLSAEQEDELAVLKKQVEALLQEKEELLSRHSEQIALLELKNAELIAEKEELAIKQIKVLQQENEDPSSRHSEQIALLELKNAELIAENVLLQEKVSALTHRIYGGASDSSDFSVPSTSQPSEMVPSSPTRNSLSRDEMAESLLQLALDPPSHVEDTSPASSDQDSESASEDSDSEQEPDECKPYTLSDFESSEYTSDAGSDSDSSSDEEEIKKREPAWAKDTTLKESLIVQANIDPDDLFPPHQAQVCNLKNLFVKTKRRVQDRSSTADLAKLCEDDHVNYKILMNYENALL